MILSYFIDWNIITMNGRSIIMTFLFDLMSLLFMGFVFIISSLVILHSDDYVFGDLIIIRFIWLVLIFVVSIMFLIISPNVISILLECCLQPVWRISLLSVQWINSWWWTYELYETCRFSWQNKFVKLVHLVAFYYKEICYDAWSRERKKINSEVYFCGEILVEEKMR